AGAEEAGKPPEEAPQPRSSTTRHEVRIDGQTIPYRATAGWLILKDEEGKPTARFGFTAYSREGVRDLAQRPLMFAFNGGPGSSSVWLHMGILGPRRVVVTDEGYAPPPPSQRVDNAYSVLDVTDLVMIDPVGTGFSKPLGDAKGADFWGVDQDIRSVAAFIKQYVTETGRWASPKYILGESYGGIRGAGLVHHLQSQHGMNFNGVVLVSPFLNMGSGIDGANIDTPHVLYLSTLAATAWYHGAIADRPESLEAFVAEVDRFAYEEYAPALMKGYTIAAAEKQAVADKLAAYTGTTPRYWLDADLRVSHQQYLQELKRGERVITGRIDSRFIGPAVNPLGEAMDYDPFFPAVGPAFTSAFLDYLHNELEFGRDEEYKVSNWMREWDWQHQPPSTQGWAVPWADLRPDLAMAMTMNPGLHVLVQQGYYDLATPMLATKHDINHLDVSAEARQRIRMAYYEAGHMMYLHPASMEKFRDDLAQFVRDTDRL
ncbi:MAG TPA: carboxypeptidase, partial [Thermoanaerobaculia bacterium]|nr:carboxypeptidase [Thermoanaerobaculia bacterium]